MSRSFRMHRTTRRCLIWLVTLLMLWQQTALAAYVCPTVPDVTTAALMNSMPGMDGGCAQMKGTSANPLCQKHCLPDHATQVDARTASVPISALTAVPPMLMSLAVVALQSDRTLARLDHRRTRPSSPVLLFCSLLI